MSDSTLDAATSAQPRSVQLCNVVLHAVNAQNVPIQERGTLLDGMLMAYVSMAHAVGLTEVAALVMVDEGARILRQLKLQQARAAQQQREGADATDTGANEQPVIARNLH